MDNSEDRRHKCSALIVEKQCNR